MKIKLAAIGAVLVAMATLSLPALATPTVCLKPIGVALFDLDVSYNPATGKGVDRDLIEELGRRTQCRFDISLESRVRIWTLMADGLLQMSVSGFASPERRQFADFVPYMRSRFELAMLADSAQPASPEAFLADDHLKLGVVKSYLHGPGWDDWVQSLRRRGRVLDVADTAALYRQLDAGRLQAILDRDTAFSARTAIHPTRNALTHVRWFTDRPYMELGLVLSKKTMSPELRQLIADNMVAMRQDGTLKKIYLRYLNEADAEAALVP